MKRILAMAAAISMFMAGAQWAGTATALPSAVGGPSSGLRHQAPVLPPAPWRLVQAQGKDNVIHVPEDDAEMNAAIDKARRTLPEFWGALAAPGPSEANFALKVMISDGEAVEHFWLTDIERSGDVIVGTISNDPSDVKSVRMGQRYEFSEADVSDWMYFRNGKMVGNETMRPLLKRMPEDQAERYRALYEKP